MGVPLMDGYEQERADREMLKRFGPPAPANAVEAAADALLRAQDALVATRPVGGSDDPAHTQVRVPAPEAGEITPRAGSEPISAPEPTPEPNRLLLVAQQLWYAAYPHASWHDQTEYTHELWYSKANHFIAVIAPLYRSEGMSIVAESLRRIGSAHSEWVSRDAVAELRRVR